MLMAWHARKEGVGKIGVLYGHLLKKKCIALWREFKYPLGEKRCGVWHA